MSSDAYKYWIEAVNVMTDGGTDNGERWLTITIESVMQQWSYQMKHDDCGGGGGCPTMTR